MQRGMPSYQDYPRPGEGGLESGLALFVVALLACTGIILVFVACATAPPNPACAPSKLAEIEAAYTAEMITRCKGFGFEACPDRAAVEAKYKEKRDAWSSCR